MRGSLVTAQNGVATPAAVPEKEDFVRLELNKLNEGWRYNQYGQPLMNCENNVTICHLNKLARVTTH